MTKPFEDTVRGIITRYEGVPLGDTEAQVQAIIKAHTAAVDEVWMKQILANIEFQEAATRLKDALAVVEAQLREQPK